MKLLSVASARPNFVKLAAIDHACRLPQFSDVEHVIVHTGQHYDPLFSDVFFEQLDIRLPTVNLGIHGGTREEVIDRTTEALVPVLEAERPDVVLAYGDVNGVVAAARAAKKVGIRIAHIEAGLRSFDGTMPEELNRVEVDRMADILFCTEQSGMEHLDGEGISGECFLVGNTMIDTLVRMLPKLRDAVLPPGLPSRFAIATLHRPSNVDDAETLRSVLSFVAEVSAKCPVLLPAHHRLKASLERFNLEEILPPSVLLLEPQPYVSFLRLASDSAFIVTDSGGIQEEAVLLKKRCFTLRRNTERPVTIICGSNVLIDPAMPADRETVLAFAADPVQPNITTPDFWDGKTGERIVAVLRRS